MKFGRSKERRSFTYTKLSRGFLRERKNQSSSNRDPYVSSKVKLFGAQDGDNAIRVLPRFDGEDHPYGMEVFVHYGIGPERNTYLCPKNMSGKFCPVCKEWERADKEGEDEEYVRTLKATKRIAVYLIDRNKEGDGPKMWLMPVGLEKDMAAVAEDKKSGAVLQFIDPEEGYDFNFEKKGKEKLTKYIGPAFDRDPSALSSDEDDVEKWLEYVRENPIPDVLIVHDAEVIKKALHGQSEEGEESDSPRKGGGRLRIGGGKGSRLSIGGKSRLNINRN